LIQTGHGPDRYVPSTFFDTMPSAPSQQACSNTEGPSPAIMFVEQDARLDTAQQPRQSALPVEKWAVVQILAVVLDQIEGTEHGGPRGLTLAQFIEPGQTRERVITGSDSIANT
jgi:hypothetical protein